VAKQKKMMYSRWQYLWKKVFDRSRRANFAQGIEDTEEQPRARLYHAAAQYDLERAAARLSSMSKFYDFLKAADKRNGNIQSRRRRNEEI
jgi:hypothetical protein